METAEITQKVFKASEWHDDAACQLERAVRRFDRKTLLRTLAQVVQKGDLRMRLWWVRAVESGIVTDVMCPLTRALSGAMLSEDPQSVAWIEYRAGAWGWTDPENPCCFMSPYDLAKRIFGLDFVQSFLFQIDNGGDIGAVYVLINNALHAEPGEAV